MIRLALVAFALALPAGAAAQRMVEHPVVPSAADPGVRAFDDASIALARADTPPDAPLALFMTGTGGRPANARAILQVIAGQGYRVLALAYDDTPAVVQVCARDLDPGCSAKFREMRVTGAGPGAPGIINPRAEAIVPRLEAALRTLAATTPAEGWGGYLTADGGPAWDRILVSGLSQGAGMAAFIAKRHPVRRVVLFSSPWDFTGPDRHPAPWIAAPSATPPARWFAEYHRRENTAPLIRAAYAALAIPPDHVRVFDRDLPPGTPDRPGLNPYHPSTIRDPGYADDWRAMFGRAGDALP